MTRNHTWVFPVLPYIIGEDGTIEKIIEKVKTKEHTKQIFKELE